MEDTDEDDSIVSETTLKEALEPSSLLLSFLDSPVCTGIIEQHKIQVYRIQENLINENYKLKNIRQTSLHDFFLRSCILFSFSVENLMYTKLLKICTSTS